MLAGLAVFLWGTETASRLPRSTVDEEMVVKLPKLAQLVFAFGDRYLASNAAMFRVMTTTIQKMTPERYQVQAQVQLDASMFNPAHEDNYYQAAAFLSWQKQVPVAQQILRRAAQARPYDSYPPFFYGFNLYYFEKRPVDAARFVRDAARLVPDVQERLFLESMAAKWVEKGEDLDSIIEIVKSMMRASKESAFKNYLGARVERLEGLRILRDAALQYQKEKGGVPPSLQALVDAGFVQAIPEDPFGFGYRLDDEGLPALLNSTIKK